MRLNQRLAALHTRAERFAEAAICCRNLEAVYSEAGDPDEAVRYGELARQYEERTGAAHPAQNPSTTAETSPATAWPGAATVEISGAPAVQVPEFVMQHATAEATTKSHLSPEAATEIDLSEEWEGTLPGEAVPASVPVHEAGAERTPALATQDATANHQAENAAFMARAGAAVVIGDEELSGPRLAQEVGRLLADPSLLHSMARASSELARPDAAGEIARELLAAARERRS